MSRARRQADLREELRVGRHKQRDRPGTGQLVTARQPGNGGVIFDVVGLLSGGIGDEQLRHAGAIDVYPDAAAMLGDLQASMIGKLGSGQQAMLGPRAAG